MIVITGDTCHMVYLIALILWNNSALIKPSLLHAEFHVSHECGNTLLLFLLLQFYFIQLYNAYAALVTCTRTQGYIKSYFSALIVIRRSNPCHMRVTQQPLIHPLQLCHMCFRRNIRLHFESYKSKILRV
jgi:hypothetical protein